MYNKEDDRNFYIHFNEVQFKVVMYTLHGNTEKEGGYTEKKGLY